MKGHEGGGKREGSHSSEILMSVSRQGRFDQGPRR